MKNMEEAGESPADMGPWFAAYAPATVANLGPGFDVLGMAVDKPGDAVWARLGPGSSQIRVQAGFPDVPIPTDPERNTAAVAAQVVVERAGWAGALELRVFKGLLIGSGLGSSGASAAAAAVAVNAALGEPLSLRDLLDACLKAEGAACGAAHGDNVAPCLYGGVVLLHPTTGDVVALPPPGSVVCVLCTPEVEVRTSEAREALPRHVPLADAVFNASQVGRLVHALHTSDMQLLAGALADRLHVPTRSRFIPGFELAHRAALEAGALGMSISGSGPTVFALAPSERAGAVQHALEGAFAAEGVAAMAWTAQAGAAGASVMDPAEAVLRVQAFRAVQPVK